MYDTLGVLDVEGPSRAEGTTREAASEGPGVARSRGTDPNRDGKGVAAAPWERHVVSSELVSLPRSEAVSVGGGGATVSGTPDGGESARLAKGEAEDPSGTGDDAKDESPKSAVAGGRGSDDAVATTDYRDSSAREAQGERGAGPVSEEAEAEDADRDGVESEAESVATGVSTPSSPGEPGAPDYPEVLAMSDDYVEVPPRTVSGVDSDRDPGAVYKAYLDKGGTGNGDYWAAHSEAEDGGDVVSPYARCRVGGSKRREDVVAIARVYKDAVGGTEDDPVPWREGGLYLSDEEEDAASGKLEAAAPSEVGMRRCAARSVCYDAEGDRRAAVSRESEDPMGAETEEGSTGDGIDGTGISWVPKVEVRVSLIGNEDNGDVVPVKSPPVVSSGSGNKSITGEDSDGSREGSREWSSCITMTV